MIKTPVFFASVVITVHTYCVQYLTIVTISLHPVPFIYKSNFFSDTYNVYTTAPEGAVVVSIVGLNFGVNIDVGYVVGYVNNDLGAGRAVLGCKLPGEESSFKS